jgi:hypothetical protein
MNPVKFPQANRVLVGPPGSGIGDLPSFNNGNQTISCWRMSWRERLVALVTGKVWMSVWSGATQPPVSLQVDPIEWQPAPSKRIEKKPDLTAADVQAITKATLKRLRKAGTLAALALCLAGCATQPEGPRVIEYVTPAAGMIQVQAAGAGQYPGTTQPALYQKRGDTNRVYIQALGSTNFIALPK